VNNYEYIRRQYGVPVKRLGSVLVNGKLGTITYATHHVYIRLNGERHSKPYHPTDPAIKYLEPAR
jgi:hypothetical protein